VFHFQGPGSQIIPGVIGSHEQISRGANCIAVRRVIERQGVAAKQGLFDALNAR
jgi:hypothetical protein